MHFAINTPAAVENPNATTPRARIDRVSTRMNLSPVIVMPTDVPRNTVTILIVSFCAALLSLSQTPHSRMKLPSISIPISAETSGTRSMQKMVTTNAKINFSSLPTLRRLFMRILRSFWVVSRRIIGGCIIGTSAM